jgi:hypothetical protein
MKRLWRWLMAQVPSDEQMEWDALPRTLAEHRAHQRMVEENRLIALKALERVHRNTTRSHLRRGA